MSRTNFWTITASSLGVGVFLGSVGTDIWIIAVGSITALCLFRWRFPTRWPATTYFVVVLVMTQIWYAWSAQHGRSSIQLEHTSTMVGLVKAVEHFDEGGELVVRPFGQSSVGVLIRVKDWDDNYSVGDWVRLTGRFSRLGPGLNRGDFNPASDGARRGAQWRFAGAVDLLKKSRDWRRIFQQIHQNVRLRLDSVSDDYQKRLLTGLLLGDRRSLPSAILQSFQTTGTAHLLAISGVHIGGIAVAVFGVLHYLSILLGVTMPHRMPALCAVAATIGMLVVSQFTVSACRASVMICLHLLGTAFGRRPSARDTLAIAFIFGLVPSPSLILTPGFQFSFLAVIGLMTFVTARRWPMNWIQVCIVASIATAPVQSWHFGTACPTGPVANLIVTPIAAGLVVPVAMLGVAVEPLTDRVLYIGAAMAEILAHMISEFANFGVTQVIVGQWATPLMMTLWLLPAALRWLTKAQAMVVITAAGALGASVLHEPSSFVHFISVGQGDAIVLHSAGRYALVDAGPSEGAFPLLGVLRRMGVRRLEWVLITHHHPDHFRGLATLMKHIEIGEIRHRGDSEHSQWLALIDKAKRQGVPVTQHSGHDEHFGTLSIRVFLPLLASWISENDRSIAMRIDGLAGSVLLTGDLEAIGERVLLQTNIGKIDTVQAPHHGSRTSLSDPLLSQTQPSMVVVSCGPNNRYGFPHKEITDRVKTRGLKLVSTHTKGSIRLWLDRVKNQTE